MTNTQNTLAIAPVEFVSQEVASTFANVIAKACKSHAKADQNLVGTLLSSARDIGRPVTEEDWNAHLVAPVRKAMKAKVSEISVRVYVGHAKVTAIAATGRPPISEALPLGKHWCDQLTVKRRPEGIHAWLKRVKPLLEIATRNEQGHFILPEGYSLLGELMEVPLTPEQQAKADAEHAAQHAADEAAAGSAGQSSDQEGGLNVDPAKAKADALENAATVLVGAKAAALLIALISDADGKAKLGRLMQEHAKAAKEAKARDAADAKAGESLAA